MLIMRMYTHSCVLYLCTYMFGPLWEVRGEDFETVIRADWDVVRSDDRIVALPIATVLRRAVESYSKLKAHEASCNLRSGRKIKPRRGWNSTRCWLLSKTS